jgi:hypothetical protein
VRAPAPSRAPSRADTATPAAKRARRVSHLSTASSIPLSAIVSPHAGRLDIVGAGGYHMRDPRRPTPTRPTGWTPAVRVADTPGSPAHAWLFFAGFVFFPLWWLAAALRVPPTRTLGASDAEKGVLVDDPQIERDARAWRTRCRVAAGVSLLTYVPFVVLVSVFATRR